jgi:hypothetical protein
MLGVDEWLQPTHWLRLFGVFATAGVIAIIFAETGLLFGCVLPGDSLLFTAGILTRGRAADHARGRGGRRADARPAAALADPRPPPATARGGGASAARRAVRRTGRAGAARTALRTPETISRG